MKLQVLTGQRARFVVCPTEILEDDRIEDPSTVTVYLALSKFRDYEDSSCWPSRATIAALAKVSERTVDKAIEILSSFGYLSIRSGKEAGKPNVYILSNPYGYGAQPLQGGCAAVAQGGAQPLRTNDIQWNDMLVSSQPTTPPPRRSKRPRLPDISPNFERHYWSVSDADEPILVGWVKHWKEVYPLIDVEREMWKAIDWVSAHPEKHYKRWWLFLSNWIRNAQTYAERAQNG